MYMYTYTYMHTHAHIHTEASDFPLDIIFSTAWKEMTGTQTVLK